jgi:hypothetical protein
LDETLTKFIEIKEKIADLEKRHERYREIIQKEMDRMDTQELEHSIGSKKYSIKKTLQKRETLSKADVPKSVWDEYHKTSMFHSIRVTEKDKNKDKKDKGDCGDDK